MNYIFSIHDWLPQFPLEKEYGNYSGEIITGPREICNNEQLRCEMRDQFDWGPSVPADIFIMADGEPNNRWATKIGGLPYRPSGLDWPTASNGSPFFFLAQFNFSDSRDIVGELPGDVLLVFAEDLDEGVTPGHFEWQNLGETKLITQRQIPKHRYSFAPCYGHLYRTENFPNAQGIQTTERQKYPKCRGEDVWASFHVPQYHATQIGEAPFLIQGRDDEQPGRLLCTISSVHPNERLTYPFVNHREPLMHEGKSTHRKYLMMGDVGCIYISIDEENKLHSSASCY